MASRAKQLAAMFEQKEQESRQANARQKVPRSAASKPLNIHWSSRSQNTQNTSNASNTSNPQKPSNVPSATVSTDQISTASGSGGPHSKSNAANDPSPSMHTVKASPPPSSSVSSKATISSLSKLDGHSDPLRTAHTLNASPSDPQLSSSSQTQSVGTPQNEEMNQSQDTKSSKHRVPDDIESKSIDSVSVSTLNLSGSSNGRKVQKKTKIPSHSKAKSQEMDDREQRKMDKIAELKNVRKMKTSALLNDTAKRKKIKELKNLSGGGFKIHVNHRYILDDGRIGVCRFKGRTAFGKSSEDWIGIVVEFGRGRHNGTVNGKTYFRCREGQGAMVKTERILIDVGNRDKAPIDGAMKRKAKALSEEFAILQEEKSRAAAERKKKKKKKSWRIDDEYGGWSPPQWDDFAEDHSEMFGQKLLHSKTLLDKNKGKKAEKKKHHTEI